MSNLKTTRLTTSGGNLLHTRLASECNYLLRVLEIMAIFFIIEQFTVDTQSDEATKMEGCPSPAEWLGFLAGTRVLFFVAERVPFSCLIWRLSC